MTYPVTGLFCFGLGYSARVLVARLVAEGIPVQGTVRTPEKAQDLAQRGIEAHVFDGTAPLADFAALTDGVSHVLLSVPPAGGADPVLTHHGADLARLASRLTWVGYLSTTGVYGDRGGGCVDETSPLAPSGPRGRARVAAETGWLDLAAQAGLPVHVFRLAGIYGPGRNALETLRAGTAKRIDKPGQVFSRIHVEDLARVLLASMARPRPGRIYNVCDDNPAPPADVIAYGATLLGVPPPPLVPLAEADLSPMARSFYDDNKRVSNARIKQELGVRLAYPSYRDGLKALRSAL